MDDNEFLATFERGGFSAHEFRHRDHLRMAHLYLQRHAPRDATERACAGIQRLAATHGHAYKYNATLSRAWVHVVALAMAQHPGATFDTLITEHPQLLDKHLLLTHYTRTTLFGPQARQRWVAPDLLPLPELAA